MSDVGSMIVIILPYDSRTTVSTPGTAGLPHGSVREAIAFAIKYEERRREHHRRDIRDINRDDGSGVRLPFSGRIRVTK